MTDKERKFLEENFKAGEYTALTLLIKNADLKKFLDYLKGAGINMAAIPSVKPELDFLTVEEKDEDHAN